MIVMLCTAEDGKTGSCDCYWNNEIFSKAGIQITVEETTKVSKHLEFKRLKYRKGKDVHTVNHLFYVDWPDQGVPEIKEGYDTLIQMIDYIEKEKRKNPSPVVVHCSAG